MPKRRSRRDMITLQSLSYSQSSFWEGRLDEDALEEMRQNDQQLTREPYYIVGY